MEGCASVGGLLRFGTEFVLVAGVLACSETGNKGANVLFMVLHIKGHAREQLLDMVLEQLAGIGEDIGSTCSQAREGSGADFAVQGNGSVEQSHTVQLLGVAGKLIQVILQIAEMNSCVEERYEIHR